MIRVEHLNLITALKVDPTVSAALAFAFYFRRGRPLDVQLAVGELLPGINITGPVDHHRSIFDFPARSRSVFFAPLRNILAIKQKRAGDPD